MSNKRGLSAVVATVLILLITLALAAIIAQIVIPFVKNSLKQSTECVPYQTHFSFDSSFDYNCYKLENDGKYTYKISVKAASAESSIDKEIAGFNLIIGSEGSSKALQVKSGIAGSCNAGGIRNLENLCTSPGVLAIPKVGEVISYAYTSDKLLKSLEIGSLLSSGRACDISDSIKQIPPCKNQ